MKRILSLLLLTTLALSFASCNLLHFHRYTEATCTEPKTCEGCGKTDGEPVGHAYSVLSTAATCTEGGRNVHTCSRCGDSFIDNETEALGHTVGEWETDVEATCQNEGAQKLCCETCQELVAYEVIPITDHADEYGKCKYCGTVLNNYKAVACYTRNNSRYNKDTGEYYAYSSDDEGNTFFIFTDENAKILRFEHLVADGEKSRVTSLQLEENSDSHKVTLTVVPLTGESADGVIETACGTIDAGKFNLPSEPVFSSVYPEFLREFTDSHYDNPSLESLMSESTHAMLEAAAEFLESLAMGVNLADLGFVNYK